MLSLSLMLALCGAAPDSSAPGSADSGAKTATLDLYVFEDGAPVSGLPVEVGGARIGATDATGGLSATIPSGRQQLVVLRDGQRVVDLDLLTDVSEIVQIIASLRDGEEADLDIESSGSTAPLASEREGQQASGAAEEEEAQPPGALVGTITSSEEAQPVTNARVFFSGTTVEARTGEDGRYAVELPADSYSISVVHPDYATQTLDDIRVIPGKEVTANIELTPAGVRLQDYVVTAPYVEGSIASTLEAQRETSSVIDVLGAEQMAATGDSDAAEALQRVSGLTIESGKFVLVRGQPSRYTLTLWNGSPLPSPEPLVRTIPLDLFPTGVLSGIEVQKSYTADRLASFGSGLVDLQTRGIPDEGFVALTVSGGYNSESTFTEGLTYRGGSLDAFGYDDGTRALPDPVQASVDAGNAELPGSTQEVQSIGRSFSNNFEQFDSTLPPDFGLTLAAGNSIDIFGDGKLGAVGSAKWGTSWREQIRIQRSYEDFEGEPQLRDDFLENRTDFNADIGTLATVKAAWDKHEVASNTFYAHQTQQRTEFTDGRTERSQRGQVNSFLLSWIQRELIAQQLTGFNDFDFFRLEYRGMFASAGRYAPDRREYEYFDADPRDGRFFVFGNSGMTRQFDTVDDRVWSFGVDGTLRILDSDDTWLGLEAKVGSAGFWQDRDTIRRVYRWRPVDEAGVDRSQTRPEVLYDPIFSGDTLLFQDFSTRRQDDSIGHLYVLSGYGLVDTRLGDFIRLVGGVRYETADQEVTTFEETPDDNRAVTGGFLQEQFFPSASATWFATDDMQVRAAYGRTTAYPNLNELSSAPFVEPDSGELFFGNPDLEPATIDGVDVRWEWYPSSTESLTFGGFWKQYTDPIERTFIARSGSTPVGSFQNAESATILGLEVSGRFEFGNFRDWFGGPAILDNFYFLGNLALMRSEVELERQGIATSSNRTLDGQADYALNLQGGYSGEEHDVTIAYNSVGTRLHRAGIQGLGDVFLQPIDTLDIVWTWRVWDGDVTNGALRLAGSNLLNPTFLWLQDGEVWREYKKGVDVSLSFKLTFR
jgi:outer membrane receptor protein involved in Fe transport